ncbi:acetolactate synthase [Marinilabilia rubra]|uniref:Acetolactate synthase n=1 Tax=Marinilabilia rubra TaxID=2162893 RepID=A0A2U2B611_9BACT|nr:acetolactate synthase [Marinilabilia rubra]PWD98486.1 acetolactate synthase [Marinilabilia rubra]
MIINQLSVFLENRSGRMHEVFDILGNVNINVSACSLADTSEFGILRMIVSDPGEARRILKENQFSVNVSEVISFATPNTPGALSKTLKILSEAQIGIDYLYGFSPGDKSFIVLKTDNVQKTIDEFQKHEMELISASELYKF